jgi:hypothetical protein
MLKKITIYQKYQCICKHQPEKHLAWGQTFEEWLTFKLKSL